MSDHERWDETRRLGPDETQRVDPGGSGGAGRSDADRTQRLDPDRTSQLGEGQEAGPTREFDAVGDSTYADPDYDYRSGGVAEEEVVDEYQEPPRRRDGWRSALLVLLGIGIGFVAALVVVALFGGEGGDPDAVASRDERIAELEDELADAGQRNEDLEEGLAQRDDQIEDLQGGLEDAEGDLAQRQQELDDRERDLDQREQELDDREDALEEREAEEPSGDGDGDSDSDPPDDGDDSGRPDFDEDEAEALVDRVIERIRDLFR